MPNPLNPLFGIQDLLRITSAPTGDFGKIGQVLQGQTLAVQGTYQCDIDTSGIGTVEVHVSASAQTASPTLAFNSLHADGGTYQASTPAGAAIVANTQQDLKIVSVGEHKMRLTITVPAGGSAGPFTRACFNGL